MQPGRARLFGVEGNRGFAARAPIPDAFRHLGSLEFSKSLLSEARVTVAPGTGFGEKGEGYVRIALVENEQRLRQAARGVKAFLAAG